ncbi:aldo/keto reductase [Nostoc sphaeroides]|uniref:aldo/keto reductase n=1 Tax=Nostoc sphaeroides TaxID=446679 RepID=UPI00226538FE|nr:aldo/keto reductase [Nostoc sphaeroides]
MSNSITLPTTKLGQTGLTVSRLCLGTMTFGLQTDEGTSRQILDTAADAGINFLDTADVYPLGGGLATAGSTEEIIGRWLKGKREHFILATKAVGKVGPAPWDQGASRKHILDAISMLPSDDWELIMLTCTNCTLMMPQPLLMRLWKHWTP